MGGGLAGASVALLCYNPQPPPEELLREFYLTPDLNISFQHGTGCPRCNYSGYAGRQPIVELWLPMPVQRIKSHPRVETNLGRVAFQRGPLVYCLEAVDNGGHVRNLVIPPEAPLIVL